jgi:hypothetical protein
MFFVTLVGEQRLPVGIKHLLGTLAALLSRSDAVRKRHSRDRRPPAR